MDCLADPIRNLSLEEEEEDVELIDLDTLSPAELVQLARSDYEVVVEELLRNSPHRILEAVDEHGVTLLHLLAANGASKLIKEILDGKEDMGSFVNLPNEQGNTALHWASLNGHLDAVKTLLAHGADPRQSNRAGREPLMEAEQGGHGSIAEVLAEHLSTMENNIDEKSESVQSLNK